MLCFIYLLEILINGCRKIDNPDKSTSIHMMLRICDCTYIIHFNKIQHILFCENLICEINYFKKIYKSYFDMKKMYIYMLSC